MKRSPPLPPIVHLIVLRPNGLELARDPLLFASAATVAARAGDWRQAIRSKRGWTPTFRVVVTHRDVTPFVDVDETAKYLPGG